MLAKVEKDIIDSLQKVFYKYSTGCIRFFWKLSLGSARDHEQNRMKNYKLKIKLYVPTQTPTI